jgi:1,4-alpha-glucan branching enzyme
VPLRLVGSEMCIRDSDKGEFGGSDYPTKGAVMTEEYGWHGKAFSISISLPPLSCLILKA